MKNVTKMMTLLLVFASFTFAHRAILMVEDNEDGTIFIQAGLSTGTVPAGSKIILKEKSTGRPLWQGKVPSDGKLTVKQPTVPYTVTLDSGEGHAMSQEGPLANQKKSDTTVTFPTPLTTVVTDSAKTE